ncbi:MAG TPA: hypothetical protein VHT96_06895, partial [Clostridia bacterium]|nr:hypothetical protein [Clostridia bacterium]
MDALSFNVLCNIIASIIYDISKWGIGKLTNKKSEINIPNIEKYVIERIDAKFMILCDSSIFQKFIKSPIILDTINNFILYKITGKYEQMMVKVKELKKSSISEEDIINYLTANLLIRYSRENTITMPNKQLINEFFTELFKISSEFIFENMKDDALPVIYFVNKRIDSVGYSLLLKMQEMITLLEKSITVEVVDFEQKFTEVKDEYIRILRENHKKAHIYLLDTFDFKEFYVPPFLLDCSQGNNNTWEMGHYKRIEKNRYTAGPSSDSNELFDDWKHVFNKNNLVYITGGAGYGKSLFMKKLINDYAYLNIIKSSDYLVIYGELKAFFPNNSESPISMLEFLQQSMENETLIDKS